MTLLNLLLFIIIGVSITNLAVNASILDTPREFIINKVEDSKYFAWVGKLITCMMCSGFWVGFLLSFDNNFQISPIYAGAIISLAAQTVGTLLDYLDVGIVYKGSLTEEIENNAEEN